MVVQSNAIKVAQHDFEVQVYQTRVPNMLAPSLPRFFPPEDLRYYQAVSVKCFFINEQNKGQLF